MEFSKWRQNVLFVIGCIFVLNVAFLLVFALSPKELTPEHMIFLAAGQGTMSAVALAFAKMGKDDNK